MTTHTHDDLADAFADPALAALLDELDALAAQAPPPVGAELAAVLAGAVPLAAGRSRGRRTASFAVIALLSGGVVAGGVGAAAADELPAPVQRVVSRVVSTLTPFEVPHPDHAPVHHAPGPARPSPSSPVVPDDDRDAGLPAEAPERTDPPPAERDDPETRSEEDSSEDSAEDSVEDSVEEQEERAVSDDERGSTDDRTDGTDGAGADSGGEDRRGDETTDEHEGDGSDTEHDD